MAERRSGTHGTETREPKGRTGGGPGSLFVTGNTTEALTYEPVFSDYYVRKFASDGTPEWTKFFPGPADEEAFDIEVDGTGVYVTGAQFGNDGTGTIVPQGAFVRKLSLTGEPLWLKAYGPGITIRDIELDSNGNLLALVGATGPGGSGMVLRRYSATGAVRRQTPVPFTRAALATWRTNSIIVGDTPAGLQLEMRDALGGLRWSESLPGTADGPLSLDADDRGRSYVVAGGTVRSFDRYGAERWDNDSNSLAGAIHISVDGAGFGYVATMTSTDPENLVIVKRIKPNGSIRSASAFQLTNDEFHVTDLLADTSGRAILTGGAQGAPAFGLPGNFYGWLLALDQLF